MVVDKIGSGEAICVATCGANSHKGYEFEKKMLTAYVITIISLGPYILIAT
jgi:hypothetical protein